MSKNNLFYPCQHNCGTPMVMNICEKECERNNMFTDSYDKYGFDRRGYDEDGFDRRGYDKDGFDRRGYDKDGFDRRGYDKDGFDRRGYDKNGFDRNGFDRKGYDEDGFNRKGYDEDGFNRKGYDKYGFNRKGYDEDGFDRNGFDRRGYDKDGFDIKGYDEDGLNRKGYDKDGLNRRGHEEDTLNRNGYDKDGFDKRGYNKDGFDRKGYDKDGFDRRGYDKDGFDRKGYDKDGFDRKGYDEEGFDRKGYDKDGFDRKGYDEDGLNRKGYDKDGFDIKGYDEDGFNRKGYDKDGFNRKGFDRKGNKKDGDDDKNEVEEADSIRSQEITLDHADVTNCGLSSGYYKIYNHVGRQGFSTSDLLEAFYPEMYSNPKIAEHLKMGSKIFYGAVNYKFTFSEPFDFSWATASNMWCKKCTDVPQEIACQSNEARSFCYPIGYYADQNYSRNFFAEKSCPNLVKTSGSATIKAKQVAPLILVNNLGQMIDKEGSNTQMTYAQLMPYLKVNGRIKDCAGDARCKSFAEIMKKVAWDTDKEVLLKIGFDDVQKANPYYYNNEDNSVSVDTNFI